MSYGPSDLELARRHVREGEARVLQQISLIATLREKGASTELAEQLLAAFEDTLEWMRRHRIQIEAALSEP